MGSSNNSSTVLLVGFTLSQATKALRESRGIALLYFRSLHYKWVRGQHHAPAAPYLRERVLLLVLVVLLVVFVINKYSN